MAGLVFDSGPLIALERGDARAEAWLQLAIERGLVPTVPAVVVAETWRGGARSARLARILRLCRVRQLDDPLARAAGTLLAARQSSATIDAIVVAAAAAEGANVLTGDPGDLSPLADGLDVRVLDLRAPAG